MSLGNLQSCIVQGTPALAKVVPGEPLRGHGPARSGEQGGLQTLGDAP